MQMMDRKFDDKHHRCTLTRYLKTQHWSSSKGRVFPYFLIVLSVAVINGYKLEVYLCKLFTFLLSASCLGTFPTSRYPYPDYKPLLDLELIL